MTFKNMGEAGFCEGAVHWMEVNLVNFNLTSKWNPQWHKKDLKSGEEMDFEVIKVNRNIPGPRLRT